MCRWFAYVSHHEVLLEDVLIDPPHAVTKQVHEHYLPGLIHTTPGEAPDEIAAAEKDVQLRNIMFNIDGFGVAWYTTARAQFEPDFTQGPRPAMYKTVAPALTDPTFTFICGNTGSKTVLAHVRAASAPPIVPTNNHPFIKGRHSFMHNGGVTNFGKIRQAILTLISQENVAWIQGNSDTEHCAALYWTYLGDTDKTHPVEHMRDCLARVIKTIQDVQSQILTPEQLKESANSLNLCTTDGEQMVAIRWRNSDVQQPPSLYASTSAGVKLNRKHPGLSTDGVATPQELTSQIGSARELSHEKNAHGLHLIVASEPSTYDPKDWKLIDKNDYVMVDKDMNLTVDALKLPQ